MTTTGKSVLAVVLLLVVIGGGLAIYHMHHQKEAVASATATSTDDGTLPTSPSDTSDAALEQDSAAIDAQMNGLGSDTATVDQGVTDASAQ